MSHNENLNRAYLPVGVETFWDHMHRPDGHWPNRSQLWSMHWAAVNRWRLTKKRPGLIADTACWIFVARAVSGECHMLAGYTDAAIWFSPEDEQNVSLEQNYGAEDISQDAQLQMAADCYRFFEQVKAYVDPDNDAEMHALGHDFFLTRNGHGAGFWDGDWDHKPADAVQALTEQSKLMGSWCLMPGTDGILYSSS